MGANAQQAVFIQNLSQTTINTTDFRYCTNAGCHKQLLVKLDVYTNSDPSPYFVAMEFFHSPGEVGRFMSGSE